MQWHIILDISAGLLILGLLLAGAYETIAVVNSHIPFTANLPLITDIVRPFIKTHRLLSLSIASIIVAAFFWLFVHFYIA